jgi:hypothetical protein
MNCDFIEVMTTAAINVLRVLDSNIGNALITSTATFIVGLIAFVGVVYQIKETARRTLSVEVYKDVRSAIQKALDDSHAYTFVADKIIIDLDNYAEMSKSIPSFPIPEDRLDELLTAREKKTNSVIHLMSVLDSWRLIDLRMRLFNTALNVAIKDCSKSFAPYYQAFLVIKPKPHLKWEAPSHDDLSKFKALDKSMRASEWQLICFLVDCLTETQQLLLGTLYSSPINRRSVSEDAAIILRLDSWEQQNAELTLRLNRHLHGKP